MVQVLLELEELELHLLHHPWLAFPETLTTLNTVACDNEVAVPNVVGTAISLPIINVLAIVNL